MHSPMAVLKLCFQMAFGCKSLGKKKKALILLQRNSPKIKICSVHEVLVYKMDLGVTAHFPLFCKLSCETVSPEIIYAGDTYQHKGSTTSRGFYLAVRGNNWVFMGVNGLNVLPPPCKFIC